MFESANLAHHVAKAAYKREEAALRRQLLEAQYRLRKDGRFATLILIAGVQGAGRGESVNLLNEWMDPRHIETQAFEAPTEEERERPELWRYWKVLPPKGKIGVFFGAWHSGPILRRVAGESSDDAFAHEIAQISRFERMLADEGVLLLKYWFHVSRKEQKKRLKEADEKAEAPYRKIVTVAEAFLRRTSTAEAPWTVVPGDDKRFRALAIGRHLLSALLDRLEEPERRPARPARRAPQPAVPEANVLRALRLDRRVTKARYKKEYERLRERLRSLTAAKRFKRISVVAVFEGQDAAGKGGAIRRITRALDARLYHTVPIAAPTEEERVQPYLWRFWRHLPRRGHFTLYDRSWYGRVLVERVEKLVPERDWRRAYSEINDFEQALVHHAIVVAKFWLAISQDEQLRRFRERERISFKRYKITPEDWRNRKNWDAYEAAVCEMVDRTSSSIAPWTLVEADNKYHARLKVLETLCDAIQEALERKPVRP
jgi:polyphosphate:AMP phosphotransferase